MAFQWLPFHKQPSFAKRRRQLAEDVSYPSPFLKKAKTEKLDEENVILNGLEIGHSSIQGFRVSMEDQHIISTFDSLPDHTLVGIIDGHAGDGTALAVSTMLVEVIENTSQWKEYTALWKNQKTVPNGTEESKSEARLHALGRSASEALVQAFVDMDEQLLEIDCVDESGAAVVVCLITPQLVVCASVGDSRAVISTGNKVTALTEDHKPRLKGEMARIESAGGFVMMDRVLGELAMSRALGDFRYKKNDELSAAQQMVTCYPDISIQVRSPEDKTLLLACDGVWDVLDESDAISFVEDVVFRMSSTTSDVSAMEAASALVDLALAEHSTDNISAIVVKM